MNLPAIDLAALAGGSEAERQRLRDAAHDAGAFVLTGHGVEPAAADRLLAASRSFFALPRAERDAIDMIHSPHFRGYSAAGSERTLGQPDLREQLDIGPEEAPHPAAPGEPAYRRLQGPNLWPAALPGLRTAVLAWMQQQRSVSARLLAALAAAAGVPHATLAAGFSGALHERVKIIKYPAADPAGSQQGVGEHSDSGVLTLIVQDGTRGLQVRVDGAFVDVAAERGALIAVLGRALQHATAGATNAAQHRVASPPPGRERISVAYFYNPRLDYAGYGDDLLNVQLRSHPHVAERYFADLSTRR